MESDPWPEVTVSKLDCARSQFDTAITLWFHDGDPVSIHSLAGGAHHVCHDLIRKKKGISTKVGASPMIFNEALWGARYAAFKKEILDIEVFFKHADKDPAGTLTFHPLTTCFYLLDGLEIFHELGQDFTPLMMIFRARFSFLFPALFSGALKEGLPKGIPVELGNMSKLEFLNVALKNFFSLAT